ncbi:hypothetical protein SH139x_002448 [Planctomycetaceae bacterium SH139]
MLEIFALPYFAITGVVGWAVFEPFFRADDTELSFSFAKIAIADLLAVCLPVGVLLSAARWMMPVTNLSLAAQTIVLAIALLFALFALLAGLFLVRRMIEITFLKRLAVVGIIAPFGILLTIGWVAFLVWSCSFSMSYAFPSSLAIAAATYGLRIVGLWVCQIETKVVEKSADQSA